MSHKTWILSNDNVSVRGRSSFRFSNLVSVCQDVNIDVNSLPTPDRDGSLIRQFLWGALQLQAQ